jgi:hypothetical protein
VGADIAGRAGQQVPLPADAQPIEAIAPIVVASQPKDPPGSNVGRNRLETLAARYATGEAYWGFPVTLAPIAKRLFDKASSAVIAVLGALISVVVGVVAVGHLVSGWSTVPDRGGDLRVERGGCRGNSGCRFV